MFKAIDRRQFTILMIVFVQMVGASMILPILPIYARRQFAMSEEVVTLLFSSFFLAQFLAGPWLGRLSDVHGRLPILIVSQIGTVISFVIIGIAPNVAWLFFARIFDGITGGNIVVAQAYMTDITPHNQRTQALGYIFAAFGAAFTIGPAVGGILSAALGPRIPFIIAAIAAALTVVLTWYALDESVTPERKAANRAKGTASLQPRQVAQNVPLLVVLVTVLFLMISLSILQATFALYGEDVIYVDYPEQEATLGIGLLLSFAGIGQIITQVFILKRLLRIFHEPTLVIIGSVIRGVGTLILLAVVTPWMAAPALMMFAMGGGVAMPALQSMSTDTMGEELRGAVLGLYQSASSLATIVGSGLSGVLYATAISLPFILSGGLSILVVFPALYLAHALRKRSVAPQPVQ